MPQKEEHLDVILYDKVVARITAKHDIMRLEYASEDALPLTPLLDPHDNLVWQDRKPDKGPVASYVEGLLPEDPAERRRVVTSTGLKGRPTPFRLITVVGLDCPGAVKLCDPAQTGNLLRNEGGLTPLSTDQVTRQLMSLTINNHSRDYRKTHWSLPGAQSKAAYRVKNDGSWWVPYGAEPTNVIVKPSLPGLLDQARNEQACLLAAGDVGLRAADTDILTMDRHDYVMSWRFDRTGDPDGHMERIHQMDFCQALGYTSDRKYEEDGGPTLADMVRLAERLDHEMPYEMLRQVQFNVLAGATDLHSKNMSIQLLPDGSYRMSPMYDVASIVPYMEDLDDPDLRFSYRVGGKDDFPSLADAGLWHDYAEGLGLDGARVADGFDELADSVPETLMGRFGELDGGKADRLMRDRMRVFLDGMGGSGRAGRASVPAVGGKVWVPSYMRGGKRVSGYWRNR